MTGVWGRAPSGFQGQSPWSGGEAPWSWKHFGHWMSNGSRQIYPLSKNVLSNFVTRNKVLNHCRVINAVQKVFMNVQSHNRIQTFGRHGWPKVSLQPAHGWERLFSIIACGFINNNEFILPKTVCFVTVHWCQSWGGAECMVPPNSVIGGACVIHQEGYNSFAPSALLDHTG